MEVTEFASGYLELNILRIEPNVVAFLELVGRSLAGLIGIPLVGLFESKCSFGVLPNVLQVPKAVVDRSESSSLANRDVKVRNVAVENFKWRAVVSGVNAGVDHKLSHWEVLVPIVLSAIDVKAEIFLDFLIGAFSLTIGLRVIGRGEVGLDTESTK